jgi:hypothetical protein
MIKDKLFCITGGLENFPVKKDAYSEIIHHGGNTTDRISNACDFLILGAKGNPNYAQGKKGNKQLKAEKWATQGYPIKIISENQFVALLEDSEELCEEYWGSNLTGQNKQRSPIQRYTKDGLEISKAIWSPKPNINQVLRVGFKTHETDESIIDKWRTPLQKTKSILTDLKNSVRTEVIPIGWIDSDRKSSSTGNVILSCRIIALLSTSEQKDKTEEIVDAITSLLVENQIEGTLSLRVWDETYRYGKYWIEKLI